MKVQFILDLDKPEDRPEFNKLSKANDMTNLIWDFEQKMREVIKYGDDENKVSAFEIVREVWLEIKEDNGLTNFDFNQ